MFNDEIFGLFVEDLLNSAIEEFNETEKHKEYLEKLDEVKRECAVRFPSKVVMDFIEECFTFLLEEQKEREIFIYNKAFLDCVKSLKHMGVL